MATSNYTGRFAPSPTGPLHLGSLATALGSWLDARVNGGRWLLRIEDTDTPRCVPGAAQDIIRTLEIFGLNWDGDIVWQSQRESAYREALKQLETGGYIFACACSRKDIEQAIGATERHRSQHYPGTCRKGLLPDKTARALRFATCDARHEQPVFAAWHEWGEGLIEENVETVHGDFVVHRADGLWAYQLAVVVDDLAQGITHVVRGTDLKDSTGRQVALMNALMGTKSGKMTDALTTAEDSAGNANSPVTPATSVPVYWHLPLVLNDRGEKLSKQAGALALNTSQPVEELNAAWTVFGMPGMKADSPQHWLKQALPVWERYRHSRKFAD